MKILNHKDNMRPIVVAGAASGVGKTTVATGLMGAFRRRGLRVAPFKAGPDYIDPGFHTAAAGIPSRNLDTWLTSPEMVQRIYARGSEGADVSVVEGVMGLFDGRSGAGNEGSTAEIAGLVGGRVVLVADCSRQSRSLAPVLSGFASFDPNVEIAGVILNNVGSASHARVLEAAANEAQMQVFGVLPRSSGVSMPSRHLGLVPAGEGEAKMEVLEGIFDHVAEYVDLDGLLSLAAAENPGSRSENKASRDPDINPAMSQPGGCSPASGTSAQGVAAKPVNKRVRLAVARDKAFSFYYVDSLEALEQAGAEIVPFSPLMDERLPDCDGLYLGGGFPEVFAEELETNATMRDSLAAAAREGLPIYAECGGLVYLCSDLEIGGVRRSMAGAIPLTARMTGRRQALGYVEAAARRDSLLFEAGERTRGHEFHWSDIGWREGNIAYECSSSRELDPRANGFCKGQLLASYIHIHFAGNLNAAVRFIGACAGVEGEAFVAVD